MFTLSTRYILSTNFKKKAMTETLNIFKTDTTSFFHSSPARHQARVLNGKLLAKQIHDKLKDEVNGRILAGFRPPHLTAILVGDDPVSSTYIRMKTKAALYIGITSHTISLPKSTHEEDVLDQLNKLNADDSVDGILIQVKLTHQYNKMPEENKEVKKIFGYHGGKFYFHVADTDGLPLPRHMNERRLCNAVSPLKDVDGFHFVNMGYFSMNMKGLAPCTALGVAELIAHAGVETKGKNAVVCGRSKNVGLPIAMLLHSGDDGDTTGLNTSTTICHRFTPPEQLTYFTKAADIIVSAAGVPGLITAEMVKEGACVIDVGITRLPDGRMVGDVDFTGVSQKAKFITPVPGGVGPMTVAMLMRNTVEASGFSESSNFRLSSP